MRKVLGLQPSPIPCILRLNILLHAIFHAFIFVHYVPYFSIYMLNALIYVACMIKALINKVIVMLIRVV